MDILKYSGEVTIEKVLLDGRKKKIFSNHNVGTEALARLLLRTLCYGATSVSNDEKPYRIRLTKNNNTQQGPYSPIAVPVYSLATGSTEGELTLTFYLPPFEIAEGGNNVKIQLLAASEDTVLAEVDTGTTSYKVEDGETHVINWTLKVSVA